MLEPCRTITIESDQDRTTVQVVLQRCVSDYGHAATRNLQRHSTPRPSIEDSLERWSSTVRIVSFEHPTNHKMQSQIENHPEHESV